MGQANRDDTRTELSGHRQPGLTDEDGLIGHTTTTSCSYVLCVLMALGMCIFVKVMSSLMSVRSLPPPILVCLPCLCVCWCSGLFLVF